MNKILSLTMAVIMIFTLAVFSSAKVANPNALPVAYDMRDSGFAFEEEISANSSYAFRLNYSGPESSYHDITAVKISNDKAIDPASIKFYDGIEGSTWAYFEFDTENIEDPNGEEVKISINYKHYIKTSAGTYKVNRESMLLYYTVIGTTTPVSTSQSIVKNAIYDFGSVTGYDYFDFELDNDGIFTVRANSSQPDVVMTYIHDNDEDIYDLDINIFDVIKFIGSPRFNSLGTLTFEAYEDKDLIYVYEYKNGVLTPLKLEDDVYTSNTRTLGTYIFSYKPLKTAAPTVPAAPIVTPYIPINPATGSKC